MEKPLVSIITSTYNSEKTIGKAMESVLSQSYQNIEYIIADGASTDDTLKIVENYKKKFEEKGIELKIISGPDSGIYGGMNKGIRASKGKIVGLVNSDDWYEADIVEVIVNEYIKSPFDMCYCDVNVVNSREELIMVKHSKLMKHFYTTRKWNHPTTFISKEIYEVRQYDERFRYYADWDMMLWIFKHYKNIRVINKPLSNFRIGGLTTSKDFKVALKKMKERYRVYRNNKYSVFYIFECILMDIGKEIIVRLKN